ncbi:hypothetical protein Gotur_032894 [Gossypium turneri]
MTHLLTVVAHDHRFTYMTILMSIGLSFWNFQNARNLWKKIDVYVKTLASVVGSEEEAKKRIYSFFTTTYTGWMPRDVTQNR